MRQATKQGISRATWVFMAFLLLGGLLHSFDRRDLAYIPNTLFFATVFAIYTGLVMYWMQTVRDRLVPSISRGYTLAAAGMMLLYLLLRALKYRMAEIPLIARLLWYLYYIPMIMMPTLFLMTCIRFYSGKDSPPRELALLAPSLFFCFAVLTNDLHHWVFISGIDPSLLDGRFGTYSYGFLFWLIYGWIGLTIVSGVLILLWKAHRLHEWQRGMWPILFLAAIPILTYLNDALESHGLHRVYAVPEIHVFCMLGVFEACIRSRLMPRNDNYPAFFSGLQIPAMITDQSMKPVYQSAGTLDITLAQMHSVLEAPEVLDEDTCLFGKPLHGGYAYWSVDESTLHRLNERLEEANETIGLENRLVQYENEQREEKARIDARNAVYAKAAVVLYPVQKRIAALLDDMQPGAPDFRRQMAMACALNAFVKRKTNLILAYTESDTIQIEELYLAIREVTGFLNDCGVAASVDRQGTARMTYADTLTLYDDFLLVTEALLPKISRMMVFVRENSLILTVNCAQPEPTPKTACTLSEAYADGLLYLTLTAKGGSAA